jgi:hypothetical protein
MVCTTPPKKDKVGTSLVKAPTAQALVARQRSKVSDDTFADSDLELLNFGVAESEIICRTSSRLQSCCPDSGKLDYPVWESRWSSFCAP